MRFASCSSLNHIPAFHAVVFSAVRDFLLNVLGLRSAYIDRDDINQVRDLLGHGADPCYPVRPVLPMIDSNDAVPISRRTRSRCSSHSQHPSGNGITFFQNRDGRVKSDSASSLMVLFLLGDIVFSGGVIAPFKRLGVGQCYQHGHPIISHFLVSLPSSLLAVHVHPREPLTAMGVFLICPGFGNARMWVMLVSTVLQSPHNPVVRVTRHDIAILTGHVLEEIGADTRELPIAERLRYCV